MSGKRIKLLRRESEEIQEPEIATPVTVETLHTDAGMRFIVHFSFDLPQGTNNFYTMSEFVDKQMNDVRAEVLKKVANKLGVKVNFEE